MVTALRHGIPVVSTSEATRGIVDGYRPLGGTPIDGAMRGGGGGGRPPSEEVLTVHDEPAAFAEAAARLLLDGAQWSARSDASLRHTRTVLSERSLDVRLLALLSRLLARRCAP